jgi:hypothetical protein
MENIGASGRLNFKTLNSEIRLFNSTSDEPFEENIFANLVQQSSSSVSFNDFKVDELNRKPNILLNA